jgi:hypothetical protein
MSDYVSVIYLNLMSCKVHHSRAGTLRQIAANIPRGLSLTPPQNIEKEIKEWSLNKSSSLEKFHSVWGEMTYPWWRRILAAAILFYSDPKGGTQLMAFWFMPLRLRATARRIFLIRTSLGL